MACVRGRVTRYTTGVSFGAPLRNFSPHIFVLLMMAVVLSLAPGCSCAGSVACALRGPLNDPQNRSLRRSLMSSGLKEFCRQMTTRNAPLKMSADAPVVGRFYAQTCSQNELENGDLAVQFAGVGY